MCGRVRLSREEKNLRQLLRLNPDAVMPNLRPDWNLCPTRDIFTARLEDGKRTPGLMHWGLIPRWSKEFKMQRPTFNARVETVAELPTFRDAWAKGRRCLVVVDGWYEWRQLPDKQPFFIRMAGSESTVMAGLWEEWKDGLTGEHHKSCTVITTPPNDFMAALPHDRMPVVLDEKDWNLWLSDAPNEEVAPLLNPYEGVLEAWPVSKRVGSVKNNDPSLSEPINLAAVVKEDPKPKAERKTSAKSQGDLFGA